MTDAQMAPHATLDRAAAAAFLCTHDDFLILCHAHPDGDTLGSGFALRNMLRLMGKTAHTVCASPVPDKLTLLTDGKKDISLDTLPDDFQAGCIVSVDVASASLLGDYEKRFGTNGTVDLSIDHHGTHVPFAKNILVDGALAACTELIFDLGELLFSADEQRPLPKDISALLYAGMSTDSGSFQYSAVTAETHRRAAVLQASGIDHAEICRALYGSRSMSEIMAAKAAYADLRFFADGKITLVTFTEEIMCEYGLRDEDIDDVINLIRGIKGVMLAIHIKWRGEGNFKVSMRSVAPISASDICRQLGGGGHMLAAGCTVMADTAKEAEEVVLEKAYQALGI